MRAGVLVWLCLVANLAAGDDLPALPEDGLGWIEARSPNFIFFSNAGTRKTQRIANDLEELWLVLERYSTWRVESAVPTLVYIFENDRSFTPYKYLYEGSPADINGFFRATPHARYIALDASDAYDSGVLYHELVHCFVSESMPDLPLWLNEGFAELYQTFEVTRRVVRIGKPVDAHLRWLRDNPTIDLQALMAVDRESRLYNHKDLKEGFYAQSWALVHYLVMGSSNEPNRLQRYLQLLGNGADLKVAFRQAFGDDLPTLERELRSYVSEGRFEHVTLEVAVRADVRVDVRPLRRSMAWYRLGDLLVHEEPVRPEAESHLQAALLVEPELGLATAALARIAERRSDWRRAGELYALAIRSEPDDAMVLFWSGEYFAASGGDLEAAARLLRRSIELEPDFGPTWAALARVLIEADGEAGEALSAARVAHRLMPLNSDTARDLLRAQVAARLWNEARELIDRRLSRSPEERGEALEIFARGSLVSIQELLLDGRDDDAVALLEIIDNDLPGAVDQGDLKRVADGLRASVDRRRMEERYRVAERAVAEGDTVAAREALVEILDRAPASDLALAARRLLERIDVSETASEAVGESDGW